MLRGCRSGHIPSSDGFVAGGQSQVTVARVGEVTFTPVLFARYRTAGDYPAWGCAGPPSWTTMAETVRLAPPASGQPLIRRSTHCRRGGGFMASPMRTISLPSGDQIPVLGQGTWGLGESRARRSSEIAALRRGLDIGMNLIDTAERYANGDTEILVGEAIAGRRDEVFLVTKAWPHHATREGTVQACQGSLRRLKTDWIDLYLLHWRGPVPLAETLEGFRDLRDAGLIRNWGVSNFDVSDLDDLMSLPGSLNVVTDQVLYNLSRRAPEFDLFPACRELGVPIMAYSPVEQGRILGNPVLRDIANRLDASPVQVALAWVLRLDNICAIPRSSRSEHVYENRAALTIHLDRDALAALDVEFPPPLHAQPLEVL
jgi:diketogulonate reductase-like aldo/keto reductase